MEISGTLTDEELVDYISLRLKLETLNNLVKSGEYSDTEKIQFMRIYFKEVR